MKAAHESTQARLRALVLIVMWLITPSMSAMSGAAHAAVIGTVVAWGDNLYGQTDVPAGLRSITAIAAGGYYSVALKSSYRFSGFLGPVNAPPIVNTLKAGAGVPVKFGLGGNQGLNSSPTATQLHGRSRAAPTPPPTKSSRP